MNCSRCGRALKHPSPTLLGPRCQVAVLGHKPRQERATRVSRDADTPDMFQEALTAANRFNELAIVLVMTWPACLTANIQQEIE